MPTYNFSAIPAELRELRQWCLWKYEDKGSGKPTKVPYSYNGNLASVTNPASWCDFDTAFNVYNMGGYDGLGFIFTENDPYAFIDLDHTTDKADYERQLRVNREFDSYSEVSPSGMGLHIIIKGSIPQGRKRSSIEIYSSGRYATMTGVVYDNKPIVDRHELLNMLFQQMGGPPQTYSVIDEPQSEDDNKIIETASQALNGAKFTDLFCGKWDSYYPTQSEADFALVDIIAFYTQNRNQIDRIFKKSELGKRDKANRKDYMSYMINKSFDRQLPKLDMDGWKIQLEDALHYQQQQLNLPLGASPSGKATAFDAVITGSNPVAPANNINSSHINNDYNGSVAQRLVPVAHNGSDAGSNPATPTIDPPPGLVGEIAQFIYQSAPRPVPEIAIAGAMGLMAGICGRAYNVSGTGLNQYILLLAKTGCHAKGTKILMYNGILKNVEDIKINDLLMGPDSSPRKVLSLARGREIMVKIKPTKGEEFIINENHILSLVDTETRVRTNLTFIDWLHSIKTFKHRNKLERKAVEFNTNPWVLIDPWFLGAMLGDGQIGPRIALTSQDDIIRNKAKSIVQSLGMIIRTSQIVGNAAFQDSYIKINNGSNSKSILQRYFETYGLWLSRSDNKFIPTEYKIANREIRLQVLAGLLDTDGSLVCNGYDYISKSKQLAEDVCFIARSLGLAAYMKSCEKYSQNKTGGIYYRVSISGDCSVIPLVLDYKKAKPRLQKKDVLVTGFDFEYLSEDDYYGFALDKDHLYLTGDFTVHHNTGKEAMAYGIDKIINAVQLSVPVASEFVGPSEIQSGQALIKNLSENASYVSLLGEFGLRLRAMSSDKANGAEIALRRMLLDLYNKSGYGQVIRPTIYSDKAKNIASIPSPAFSILGESTPERFYEILTEEMISEGLLPRFTIIEYNGIRPPFNENAVNIQPPLPLVEKIASLMANAKTVLSNRKVINIECTPEADKVLRDFDKLADNKINNTHREVILQLWNRAHIKALKIAGLLACGQNIFNPVIQLSDVRWAISLIEHDIKALSEKFDKGVIGKSSDENKQVDEMIRVFKEYVTYPWDKVKKYSDNPILFNARIITNSYIMRRCAALSAFKNDRIGSTSSIKRTIQVLLDSDFIREVGRKDLIDKYKTTQKSYMITNMHLIGEMN